MEADMKMLDEIIKRVGNLTEDQQKEILAILRDWQSGKQREYQRSKSQVGIDVVVGDRVIQTDSRDISASGVFIHTSGKFEPNKSVRIVFSVPGSEKPFKLSGLIVRAEESGMAIEFENITPYFKKILDDAIWKTKSEDDQ